MLLTGESVPQIVIEDCFKVERKIHTRLDIKNNIASKTKKELRKRLRS